MTLEDVADDLADVSDSLEALHEKVDELAAKMGEGGAAGLMKLLDHPMGSKIAERALGLSGKLEGVFDALAARASKTIAGDAGE